MRPLKRWLRYKVIYWALIQHDQCPYKKKRLGHRSRGDHVRRQGEGGHRQAKERGLRMKPALADTLTLDSGFLNGEKNSSLWFKAPSLRYMVMAAGANEHTSFAES